MGSETGAATGGGVKVEGFGLSGSVSSAAGSGEKFAARSVRFWPKTKPVAKLSARSAKFCPKMKFGASDDLGERLWLGFTSDSGPVFAGEGADAGGGAVSRRTRLAEVAGSSSSSAISGDRFTGLEDYSGNNF